MSLNVAKYKTEWAKFKAAWDAGDETATHKGGQLANRFVEGCRASAYIGGHLLLVAAVIIGGLLIWALW